MDRTQFLGLPYLQAAQAQKHVTHNEALRLIDASVQLAVESRSGPAAPPSAAAPSASATSGARPSRRGSRRRACPRGRGLTAARARAPRRRGPRAACPNAVQY